MRGWRVAELCALHRSTHACGGEWRGGCSADVRNCSPLLPTGRPVSPSSLPSAAPAQGRKGSSSVCHQERFHCRRCLEKRRGVCERRDPDLRGQAAAESLLGGHRGSVSLAFCLPQSIGTGRRAPWCESRQRLAGRRALDTLLCCGSLWPEAGFLPLWVTALAGVTPGCLSVYAVYFIKELEQSRQDFSSCLSSQWSH